MKKKTSNNKKSFAWRKWVIIGSFSLLFIVLVIIMYPIKYSQTKVTPFKGKEYVETKVSDIDDFKFEFTCTEYHQTNDKVFSASVTNAKENYIFSAVKYQVALGNRRWTNYYKEASSQTTIISTFSSSTTSGNTNKKNTVKDFKCKYNKRTLLFINTKTPEAFVLLTYSKKKVGSSNSEDVKLLLTYKYSEFITENTI